MVLRHVSSRPKSSADSALTKRRKKGLNNEKRVFIIARSGLSLGIAGARLERLQQSGHLCGLFDGPLHLKRAPGDVYLSRRLANVLSTMQPGNRRGDWSQLAEVLLCAAKL